MKYLKSSVFLASLALSSAVVRASGVRGVQGRPAQTASSSLWSYFKRDKSQAAPAVRADAKSERDEPWMLVTEDEDDFAFTEEVVAKDEIKIYHQQAEDQAAKRYDEDRLARVKEAEEDETLRAWALPHEPKMSARWYQQAAPALEVGEAILVDSESDDEPTHEQIMQMFNAEAAILVDNESEDQQPELAEEIPQPPPMDDDVIPEAPPMDGAVALHVPVSNIAEDVEEPKQPSLFRGRLAQQVGFAKSNESSASAEEAVLLQQFKAQFQAAQSHEDRKRVVDSMERSVKENPAFAELLKLKVQLFLQVQREVIQVESDEEVEEASDFE